MNDGSHTYSWDACGHPVIIDGLAITYDAIGRMVERAGAYSPFYYAPTGLRMQTLAGQAVPLVGGATAVYGNGTIYLRHADHLGSSRLTTNYFDHTMYADAAYAPFGEPYAQSGATDLSFAGMNQDSVSGLYDFPARKNSIQGRWASPDPAGLLAADPANPQSWNAYAYSLNNPLAFTDPSGLDPCQGANVFEFSQAANGTGIFTPDDCLANGGTWITGVNPCYTASGPGLCGEPDPPSFTSGGGRGPIAGFPGTSSLGGNPQLARPPFWQCFDYMVDQTSLQRAFHAGDKKRISGETKHHEDASLAYSELPKEPEDRVRPQAPSSGASSWRDL